LARSPANPVAGPDLIDVSAFADLLAGMRAGRDWPLAGNADKVRALARVATGRRLARVILASLPFGFRSQEQEDAALATFREVLAA
jgi:hypothetical protein